MSSSAYLARRSLPGAVVAAVIGLLLVVVGIARSSPLRVLIGAVLLAGGALIAAVARRILTESGERLFQVTVPPRKKG